MRIRTLTARKWLAIFLLLSVTAYAATISRITTFSDGDILTAADLNTEFDNVVDGVNSINDDNIVAGAAINPSKISAVIAGTGITRNSSTGALTPTVDGVSVEVGGSGLQVKDGGIDADMLATSSVTTVKILDGTILTADIADAQITQAKRAALGHQVSASSGSATTVSDSFDAVTNLTVTITTTGRPVQLLLIGDSASTSVVGITQAAGGGQRNLGLRFKRDSTVIQTFDMEGEATVSQIVDWPPSSFAAFDVPAAGTYTYTVEFKQNAPLNPATVRVTNCKLVAYEL